MKIISYLIAILFLSTLGHAQGKNPLEKVTGYAPVHGLKMYYEIRGEDKNGTIPLVLLHGGGDTIDTSFGKIIDELAKTRKVIAFDQQGYGRTDDVKDRPFTFEQSAEDTAELMKFLKVDKADFGGFSNGSTILIYLAMNHPKLVRKMVLISGLYSRDGAPQLFKNFKHATMNDMPAQLKETYLKVAPHPEELPTMFKKSLSRMVNFKSIPDKDIKSIQAPVLLMSGDADAMSPEHTVRIFRLLQPHSQVAIFPGTDHMQITSRADIGPMITAFLEAPMPTTEKKMK